MFFARVCFLHAFVFCMRLFAAIGVEKSLLGKKFDCFHFWFSINEAHLHGGHNCIHLCNRQLLQLALNYLIHIFTAMLSFKKSWLPYYLMALVSLQNTSRSLPWEGRNLVKLEGVLTCSHPFCGQAHYLVRLEVDCSWQAQQFLNCHFGAPVCLPAWLPAWLPACLSSWLPECLPAWLLDCLTAWLPDWMIDWLIDWVTGWLTD